MMLHSIFVIPIPNEIIAEGLATGILTGDHNSILEGISRTGNIDHDWIFLKKLFASKIVEVDLLILQSYGLMQYMTGRLTFFQSTLTGT